MRSRVSLLQVGRCVRMAIGLALLALVVAVPQLYGAGKDGDDFDSYKLRIDAFWFYAQPSGDFESAGHSGIVDFQRDVGFNNYSTFSGKVDWKFTRKNHLYLAATPFSQTRQFVTNRNIVFQGQTFNVGLITSGQLQANAYAPGYQYDIIRRKRGHLGIAIQVNLFDTKGTLNAAAQVTNGIPHAAIFASGSLLAPIPVAGPDVRLYLLPNSSRLFVTGNVMGMYLFGYGNFVSTFDTLGLTLTKHLSVRAGYQLGSRLNVNTKLNRLGLSLTQKGAIVGAEFSF